MNDKDKGLIFILLSFLVYYFYCTTPQTEVICSPTGLTCYVYQGMTYTSKRKGIKTSPIMNPAHVTAVSEAAVNGSSVDADVKEEQESRFRKEPPVDDSDVDLDPQLRVAAKPTSQQALQQTQAQPPSRSIPMPSSEQSIVVKATAFHSRP